MHACLFLFFEHTFISTCVFSCPHNRYDQGGYALDGQSLTETRSAGSGAKTNWKTLSEVKNEHLGHGEKVQCILIALHNNIACHPSKDVLNLLTFKRERKTDFNG